jgi:fructosamine-3-kinase
MNSPWPDIERAIREALNVPFAVESRASLAGGSVNRAYRIQGKGLACFVKLNDAAHADMFAAEAAGLREIARADCVRVPRPICHGASDDTSWIVLEHLDLATLDEGGMRALGAGLARLHRITADRFGWHPDNTIGLTPQVNAWTDDWIVSGANGGWASS